MAAIADLSDLINRSTGGNSGTPKNEFFFKNNRVAGAAAPATIAGRPHSLWLYEGIPGAGTVPGTTGVVPTNTQTGAILLDTPGGARETWLTNFWATAITGGTLILYDRILHNGGLNATTTTAQNVGGTMTRYTDGAGNFAFVEIYTIIGTTGTTFTMSYTNEAGISARISPTVVIGGTNFREQTRALFIPLVSGDRGIQAVANVDLLATTGTAGSFGLTVGHPLATCSISVAGISGWRDFVTGLPGLPEIQSGACLSLLWIPVGTTAPEITGGYSKVEA